MKLDIIDWSIIGGYFLLALGIGFGLRKRAGKSLVEYFASGRSLPWWIAGTSMAATSFAADTPLAVTGLTAKYGVAGNWFWWAFALGGMFTVFVYARLWRRANVLTDVELVELRYSGKPAAFLRGFRALYISLLMNSIIAGWVTVAMFEILKVTLFSKEGASLTGIDDWMMIVILLGITAVYSTLSGLWGVAVTDFIQFCMAMGGCIVLAVISVNSLGGIEVVQNMVITNFEGGEQAFRFLPDFSAVNPTMPLQIFLIYLFVLWWASWYPGAEPGGGGYVVQRMASSKDEKHSLLATLWYQVAHYCLRPWPWLLIGFVAIAYYPDLRSMEKPGNGFAMVIRDFAPNGIRGLMLIAFFAAYMSTISTQVNWGASYLVSDFYKRFIRKNASDQHLTGVSRLASILILICGGIAAWFMRSISVDEAWKLLAALGAGTGAVFMLRWFWWRINAWSEISAMIASLLFYLVVSRFVDQSEYRLVIVAALTIVVWLAVTFLTPPERRETLTAFYRRVRPGGPGWDPIAKEATDVTPDRKLGVFVVMAVIAAGIVYSTLPAIGFLIFGQYGKAMLTFLSAGLCVVLVISLMKKVGWERIFQ
ncbi:MAG: Na+:solute symporter [Gemmatimonadota bacterium]|nr:MAG: Na+:solute symporter [Gemmatimonadota bacterium]